MRYLGEFYFYLFFDPVGYNYAPFILVLAGGIMGYRESTEEELKNLVKIGLILSIIGGILSIHIFLNTSYISGYTASTISYLIISCGAILGSIIGLIYTEKFGGFICFITGIIYMIYSGVISMGFFFVDLILPYSYNYNFTSFILVLIGGFISYTESQKELFEKK